MKRLPDKLEDLKDLPMARYRRESDPRSEAKYGPFAQDDAVDRFRDKYGLVDTGLVYADTASAFRRSSHRPDFRRIVGDASRSAFRVIVVPYSSRFSRDFEVWIDAKRVLHAAGAVIAFANRELLSSREEDWESLTDEMVGSEKYSRGLSRAVADTFRTKFERFGDQAGTHGVGFNRTSQPEARLVIDPETMTDAVALFERYAMGDVSYKQLGESFGLPEATVRSTLTSRLYNGWAIRHRRGEDLQVVAAQWRANPPVSDDLWARVEAVRAKRLRHGPTARVSRPYLLAKKLYCECGRSIPADTSTRRNGTEIMRYRHEPPCPFDVQMTIPAAYYEAPLVEALLAVKVDAATLAQVSELAGRVQPTTDTVRLGLERQLKEKANDHVARRITDETYLAEYHRLAAEVDALSASRPGARSWMAPQL